MPRSTPPPLFLRMGQADIVDDNVDALTHARVSLAWLHFTACWKTLLPGNHDANVGNTRGSGLEALQGRKAVEAGDQLSQPSKTFRCQAGCGRHSIVGSDEVDSNARNILPS